MAFEGTSLSFLVEWILHAKLVRPSINILVSIHMRTMMYAVRIAVAYMVMLAVLSLDVFVGHVAGFSFFGSQAFRNKSQVMDHQEPSDLPPLNY
ncbi:hypothetical protein NL676_005933 [Syzygium grande]|nr:hypothetical protein NL676_005933 [Syzygium grande]